MINMVFQLLKKKNLIAMIGKTLDYVILKILKDKKVNYNNVQLCQHY